VNAAAGPARSAPVLPLRLALAACALSFGAAVFALAYPRGCAACEASSQLGAGPVIPLLGSLWYALLLALLVRRGLDRWAALGGCVSAGVHIGLVGLMAWEREWCMTCLAAAAGAFAYATVALASRAVPRWQGALALVCAAVVAGGVLGVLGARLNYRLQRELTRAVDIARAHGPVAPGTVEMTYFKRDGCLHCAAFDHDVLPQLERRFGDKLKVVEAPAWSGIPTPTLVVRGRFEELLYPQPTLDEVSKVVQEELAP
jgi:hypothetical protein